MTMLAHAITAVLFRLILRPIGGVQEFLPLDVTITVVRSDADTDRDANSGTLDRN
jgi:hypothetical protein